MAEKLEDFALLIHPSLVVLPLVYLIPPPTLLLYFLHVQTIFPPLSFQKIALEDSSEVLKGN